MPLDDYKHGLVAAASKGHAVTPNDDQDLPTKSRALYVGGAGDLSVLFAYDKKPVTLVGVLAGSLLPVIVKRVRATGTTATNIVAMW